MARLVSWFSTRNGTLFTRSCVGLSAVAVFSSFVAVHGPCLERFREIVRLTSTDGKEKPLSDKVKQLIIKVVEDSDLSDTEKTKIKFFSFIGHDFFHAGGKNSYWGSIIGIPFTFEENIDLGKMRLAGRLDKNWIVEDPDILSAISLSENAKKFGIMREIYSCNINHVLLNALIASFCIIFPAQFGRKMNIKMNAFDKLSFRKRSVCYLIYYTFGLIVYRCFKDPLSYFFAKSCDEKAAKTSPDYLEGGIEYYEKTLKKNKCLRGLLSNGTWLYARDGNENYWVLAPKLPLTKRLEFLKKLKEN